MTVKESNKVANHELTPPYFRYLVHLIRPFPNFDLFFIKSLRQSGKLLNLLFRSLWKLSFSSTPGLNDEPWGLLENRLAELHVQEYFFGCMFLAWGSLNAGGKS